MKKAISVSVNGVSHQHEVEPRLLLVHYLRDVIGSKRLGTIITPRRSGLGSAPLKVFLRERLSWKTCGRPSIIEL
jgi:hypothetical protein